MLTAIADAGAARGVPARRQRIVRVARNRDAGRDIDILFRDRIDVDAWFDALSIEFEVETAPAWIPDASQYFARLHAPEITIELSTVEVATDRDTMECFGTGPWEHFDLIACGTGRVPAVASELRLLTEIARGRGDRYRAIAGHLRIVGCDQALIERGLADIGASPSDVERVLADVSRPRFER